jgi:sulfur-oxidizing protein SoxB
MTHTAITYSKATLNELTGKQIKEVLEDVADNLLNPDPYYQQGGDMVRVGGLKYSLDINQPIGKRISDLELKGKALDANKKYKVAGWASVQPQPDDKQEIWDVVAEYLRAKKTIKITEPYTPKLTGVEGNPGVAI